jgi:hypothetical protein
LKAAYLSAVREKTASFANLARGTPRFWAALHTSRQGGILRVNLNI